jgi:hypothetical protein
MSAPVFISYSSKDQDIAETICRALEVRGIKCWISGRDVAAGENFQEAILRAPHTSRVMLLVFTGNANNSDEIKKEVALAGRHRVTVVPVRVEDVVPSDAFAYEFATRQWIDLFKNWEQEIERLAARVRTILDTAEPQTAAPAAATIVSPPNFGKPKSSLLPLAAAAVVVIAVAGGAAVLYLRPAHAPASSLSQLVAAPPPPQASVLAASPPPAAAGPSAMIATPPAAPVPTPVTEAPPAPPAPLIQAPPAAAPPQVAAIAPPAAAQSQASAAPFDGTWLTTLNCVAGMGGRPFTYRFFGEVKDGTYRGHQGEEGQPSFFQLVGKIQPDGVASMIADGIVGNSAFAAGNLAKGMLYNYPVKAHFAADKGTGNRTDGKRACNLEFAKQ